MGYCPTPGATTRLHATSWNGRPIVVVIGRDEVAYSRHPEPAFREGAAAPATAGDDTDVFVLSSVTEGVAEQVVRQSVPTGRRVIVRRLLAVRPPDGPFRESSLLVHDIHAQRPMSESKAREQEECYKAYARAEPDAESAQ